MCCSFAFSYWWIEDILWGWDVDIKIVWIHETWYQGGFPALFMTSVHVWYTWILTHLPDPVLGMKLKIVFSLSLMIVGSANTSSFFEWNVKTLVSWIFLHHSNSWKGAPLKIVYAFRWNWSKLSSISFMSDNWFQNSVLAAFQIKE